MTITSYREQARRAQRHFTVSNTKIEVVGKNRGLKYGREIPLSVLSPSSQRVVAFRIDLVLRCLFLAAASVVLGLAIGRADFPLSWLAIPVFSVLTAGKFLWHGIQWMRGEEEVEVFSDDSGRLAFEVFNDKEGCPEYSTFISDLKAAIRAAREPSQAVERNSDTPTSPT
ncbi:MAG: hypothetical protein U1F61_16995 [Opitutaceae bacterium]